MVIIFNLFFIFNIQFLCVYSVYDLSRKWEVGAWNYVIFKFCKQNWSKKKKKRRKLNLYNQCHRFNKQIYLYADWSTANTCINSFKGKTYCCVYCWWWEQPCLFDITWWTRRNSELRRLSQVPEYNSRIMTFSQMQQYFALGPP